MLLPSVYTIHRFCRLCSCLFKQHTADWQKNGKREWAAAGVRRWRSVARRSCRPLLSALGIPILCRTPPLDVSLNATCLSESRALNSAPSAPSCPRSPHAQPEWGGDRAPTCCTGARAPRLAASCRRLPPPAPLVPTHRCGRTRMLKRPTSPPLLTRALPTATSTEKRCRRSCGRRRRRGPRWGWPKSPRCWASAGARRATKRRRLTSSGPRSWRVRAWLGGFCCLRVCML